MISFVNTDSEQLSPHGTLLLSIMQALVDMPARVSVRETQGESSSFFEVWVHPSDYGIALGKDGIVFEAVRSVMAVVGVASERNVQLSLLINRKPSTDSLTPVTPLSVDGLVALLETVVKAMVAQPERARVIHTPCKHLHVYEIEVPPCYVGTVLGRAGRTINALRLIVRAIAGKLRQPIHLHLIESVWSSQPNKREAA